MAKPKVTEREVRFARSFIKYVKGNQQNTYLLLAVIAWVRAEVGVDFRFMRGNNPFNIRRSPYASGVVYTNGNGTFAKFKSLDVAARATVAFLKSNASFGNYGPILAAMRRGDGTDADNARAGYDMLMAVAVSKWSAGHYGYRPATQGHYATRELPNGTTETYWVPGKPEKPPSLIGIWQGLLGTTIPTSWYQDTVKQVKKVIRPRQPRSLSHVLPPPAYIQPYAASAFYHDRPHMGQYVLQNIDADYDAGTEAPPEP